jgi:hypothetical protein
MPYFMRYQDMQFRHHHCRKISLSSNDSEAQNFLVNQREVTEMFEEAAPAFGLKNVITAEECVGNAIDRLITVEAKNPGMPHNVTTLMYDAARKLVDDRPISMTAALRLRETIKPGDTVLFLTGAGYLPQMPRGEDDGPPGVVSLAYAMFKGLGAVPVFVCEECHAEPILASAAASGLLVVPFEDARDRHLGAALETAPTSQEEIGRWVDNVFKEMKPKAVISAERLGPAKSGYLHNLTAQVNSGPDSLVTYKVVDISEIVTRAEKEGALSIGIGDHGNEIGFGRIQETVADVMPKGDVLCTVVGTDILLPVMMSNWGCYGIEAALAYLLKRPELMHSGKQEEIILRACLMAGGIDAVKVSSEFSVDGLDGETSMACVHFLGSIVRKALEVPDKGNAH